MSPGPESVADKFARLRAGGVYEGIGRIGPEAADVLLLAFMDAAPVSNGIENQTPGGTLRESIHYIQSASGEGSISFEYRAVDYATFVLGGTAPHLITPKGGGVLAFYTMDGNLVFARVVHHPGTLANNFVARAYQSVSAELSDIVHRGAMTMLAELLET